jgi:hypothetical protein
MAIVPAPVRIAAFMVFGVERDMMELSRASAVVIPVAWALQKVAPDQQDEGRNGSMPRMDARL